MIAKADAEPWYPEEATVPETMLHLLIRTLLFEQARAYVGERGLVGSDQFVYWARGDAHRSVAPDLYVALGRDPARMVRSWKTWQDGPIDLAVEIVSDDWHKDVVLGPVRYTEAGVRELVLFDPEPTGSPGAGRARWHVWRRSGDALALEARHDGDIVESAVLGCHLRAVGSGADLRVRLATGPDGCDLVPTAEERATDAERLAAEVAALRRQLAERDRSGS